MGRPKQAVRLGLAGQMSCRRAFLAGEVVGYDDAFDRQRGNGAEVGLSGDRRPNAERVAVKARLAQRWPGRVGGVQRATYPPVLTSTSFKSSLLPLTLILRASPMPGR